MELAEFVSRQRCRNRTSRGRGGPQRRRASDQPGDSIGLALLGRGSVVGVEPGQRRRVGDVGQFVGEHSGVGSGTGAIGQHDGVAHRGGAFADRNQRRTRSAVVTHHHVRVPDDRLCECSEALRQWSKRRSWCGIEDVEKPICAGACRLLRKDNRVHSGGASDRRLSCDRLWCELLPGQDATGTVRRHGTGRRRHWWHHAERDCGVQGGCDAGRCGGVGRQRPTKCRCAGVATEWRRRYLRRALVGLRPGTGGDGTALRRRRRETIATTATGTVDVCRGQCWSGRGR